MWQFHWRCLLKFGLLGLLVLLGGCGTIPDLRGLADATGEMRSGVVAVGNEYAALIPSDIDCQGKKCKPVFEAVWVSRVDAVAAVSDYSEALAQVAAAGRDGAERADQVLSSANGLLGALSIAPLSAPVIDAAKLALAELAKYRALRSMSEAVKAVDPLVSEVLRILDQDLATIDKTTREIASGLSALAEREDKGQTGAHMEQVKTASGHWRLQLNRDYFVLRQSLENLSALNKKANELPHPKGCGTPEGCEAVIRATDKEIEQSRVRLAALDRDLASAKAAYAPVQAEKDAISKRTAYLLAANGQLRSGLKEWTAIHHKLGNDIKKGLQPNVQQLIVTAGELKRLADEIRNAR